MVMANPAMLRHYREKMIDQIEEMLERNPHHVVPHQS
jgi:hypothetical protein